MKFNFQVNNNVAEYEALAIRLDLARRDSAWLLKVYIDNKLVTQQLQREYKVRDAILKQYHKMVS